MVSTDFLALLIGWQLLFQIYYFLPVEKTLQQFKVKMADQLSKKFPQKRQFRMIIFSP